jgi:hypothetical protein
MNDKYPGTSGNTQGERNEISPAAKANGKANKSEPEVTVEATSL